jgi:Adenylate and Guanylate cyclase catalytic domain
VTGLPDPQERHAVIMARFACECLYKMKELVQNLEVTLGPETCALQMRVGLHSGPVTAGVLRSNRPRFQLFGDTVNTAARMESTGCVGRIQCSSSTAQLLVDGGKSNWVKPRKEPVAAKGKGLLSTFWVMPFEGKRGSGDSTQTAASGLSMWVMPEASENIIKRERLVDWICELLQEQIKKILLTRAKTTGSQKNFDRVTFTPKEGTTVLDEVTEVITLPAFDPRLAKETREYHSIEMSMEAKSQLRELVSQISMLYPNNPFHNWEHVSLLAKFVLSFLNGLGNNQSVYLLYTGLPRLHEC